MLAVIYYDERMRCDTDVAGEPIPAPMMLKIPGDEYALDKAIEQWRQFANVTSYEGDYKIETAPSGERMVWINWLGSKEQLKTYLNPDGSQFRPLYVLQQLLGLAPLVNVT